MSFFLATVLTHLNQQTHRTPAFMDTMHLIVSYQLLATTYTHNSCRSRKGIVSLRARHTDITCHNLSSLVKKLLVISLSYRLKTIIWITNFSFFLKKTQNKYFWLSFAVLLLNNNQDLCKTRTYDLYPKMWRYFQPRVWSLLILTSCI